MKEYILTCNCIEALVREDLKVKANNIDEAWDKAKTKMARKYKVKKRDINITAVKQ